MKFTTQDFLGRQLSDGDFIVYAVSYGSSPHLSLARIGRVEPNPEHYRGKVPPINLPNDRVRLIVYVYQSGWGRADDEDYRRLVNVDKRIYLRTAARCIKIERPEWIESYHAAFGVPGE